MIFSPLRIGSCFLVVVCLVVFSMFIVHFAFGCVFYFVFLVCILYIFCCQGCANIFRQCQLLFNHINDSMTVCVAYAKPLHVLLASLLLYTSSSELYIVYFYFYFLSNFIYLFFQRNFSYFVIVFFCLYINFLLYVFSTNV